MKSRFRNRLPVMTGRAGAKNRAFYRQIWRLIDGAVRDALIHHPGYVAKGISARTVRRSIVKRAAGAITGYVGATVHRSRRRAEPGSSSPAADQEPVA